MLTHYTPALANRSRQQHFSPLLDLENIRKTSCSSYSFQPENSLQFVNSCRERFAICRIHTADFVFQKKYLCEMQEYRDATTAAFQPLYIHSNRSRFTAADRGGA